MPFTYSITNGIGAGFVAYCFIKLVRGKGGSVPVDDVRGRARLRDLLRAAARSSA